MTRPTRPHVLFITDAGLAGPAGWAQRSWHLIEAMRRSARVDIATMCESRAIRDANEAVCAGRAESHVDLLCEHRRFDSACARLGLSALATWLRCRRRDAVLAAHLRTVRYDAVVLRLERSSFYLQIAGDENVVFDLSDTDLEHRTAFGHSPGELLRRRVRSGTRQLFTRPTISRIRRAWIVHPDYARIYRLRRAEALPNVPGLIPPSPLPERTGPPTLLFVGDLATNKRNIWSLQFFIASILPRIRKRMACRLVLAGVMTDASRFAGIPDVEVVANPDTLDDLYARATIAIAPLLVGRGTSIKTVEALAFGRCVVGTPVAARGFEDLCGHGLWVANSAAEFAERCVTLLEDAGVRQAQAREGYDLVAARYTKEHFAAAVARLLEEACAAKNGRI